LKGTLLSCSLVESKLTDTIEVDCWKLKLIKLLNILYNQWCRTPAGGTIGKYAMETSLRSFFGIPLFLEHGNKWNQLGFTCHFLTTSTTPTTAKAATAQPEWYSCVQQSPIETSTTIL
jgi:hypothetical protein